MAPVPMKESFSVLIPDGESDFALFAAHCFSRFPNVRLHVLSQEQWTPIRFSRYCHGYSFRKVSFDGSSWLDIISTIVKKEKIDVLLPTDTQAISYAITNTDALLSFVSVAPLPDQSTFEIANNKWLLAQFLEKHQIPGPGYLLVSYDELFFKNLQAFRFPVLLKPITARSGEGIVRFDILSDLLQYLEQHQPEELDGRFIVQRLFSGNDMDLNILARSGELLASTFQKGIIPNTEKFGPPGAIEFVKEERFSEITRRLVSGLRWSGYANVDTIDDKDGNLWIVDINARFWGSLRGSLEAGVSFPYLACLAALNIPFSAPDYELIRYFHPKTGVKELISAFSKKRWKSRITFAESGLRFLLIDFLAEIMRIFIKDFPNIRELVRKITWVHPAKT